MSELRECRKCGRSFPATTEFFNLTISGKYSALRRVCKECFRKQKTKLHRVVPDAQGRRAHLECPYFHNGAQKCDLQITSCRHYLKSEFPESPFDCVLQVIDLFPNGLGYNEIGGIMGLSDQQILNIERSAMVKLRAQREQIDDITPWDC